MKSFYEWVIDKCSVKGKWVNSPTGDIAREMHDDPDFPKKETDVFAIESYLMSKMPSRDTIKVMKYQIRNYRKYLLSEEDK